MYSFHEYSADVSGFAEYPERGSNMVYPAMGVAGEAGELCDKIKKHWRNVGTRAAMSGGSLTIEQRAEIEKEIGDVLWYLNALAEEVGSNLHICAKLNYRKLLDRAARGVIKSEGDNR